MKLYHLLGLFALLTTVACGEESDPPPQTIEIDGAVDGAMDASPPDMEAVDAETADAEVDAEPPPPVVNGLTQLQGLTWRQPTAMGQDPFYELFERGLVPSINDEGSPWNWNDLVQDGGGSFPEFGNDSGYAVTEVSLDEGQYLVATVDRGFRIWTRDSVQPADIYGSGRTQTPLIARDGVAQVAALLAGQRGAPRVRLYSTSAPVVLNIHDMTRPSLRVGQDGTEVAGIPLLNNLAVELTNIEISVEGSDHFAATTRSYPGMPAGAVSQVAFELEPLAAFAEPEQTIAVQVVVNADQLDEPVTTDIEFTTIPAGQTYQQTFISPVDGSVQYYGVVPPTEVVPGRQYAVVLSLHGASVEAIGQARSYSAREWTYVIAATNRRPYGFDWEEWGRFNALASLDDAMARFTVDPTRVYLTGHSMGGHGTWHVGVTTPGRFATLGPSAGWQSFYTYGGAERPTGPFARSRAHSDTAVYLSNIAQRGIYVLHGRADDNVPWYEGRNMAQGASMYSDDVETHWEPDAGHWWDGDISPGVDCVDWQPMFDFMEARTLDPFELEFNFITPGPGYSPDHSFVHIDSALTPMADVVVNSEIINNTITLTTNNVRSMVIDGTALLDLGHNKVEWQGMRYELDEGPIYIGPQEGKTSDAYGPFNQVFRRPFCFHYPEDNAGYRKAAAFLTSHWNLYGNGRACALTDASVLGEAQGAYQWIHMGEHARHLRPEPFDWDSDGVSFNGNAYDDGAMFFVQPEFDGVSVGMVTAPDREYLIHMANPFSSRSGFPDYLVWRGTGLVATGFFDSQWQFEAMFGAP